MSEENDGYMRLSGPRDRIEAFREINAERVRQDAKWGGPKHDNGHGPNDWIVFIVKHLGRAVAWPCCPFKFRKAMIRVAALATAAVEWTYRNEQDLVALEAEQIKAAARGK